MNYDAFARLNIVRKIIDNLSPGIGQIGGIWLPLPHLLLLPFIRNDFLWHSGLAGAIVSTSAFVAAALYLEKTALMITKSLRASLAVWFIFVTNQNVLLFQTSAMSESFFLCSIIMVMFFLTKWAKSQNTIHLLTAALWVMISTLTRYEGYFVLLGSFLTVTTILFLLYGRKNMALIEGTSLLFFTIASYGIFLWCVYCMLFFKDPLYWLHFYTQPKAVQTVSISQAPTTGNIFESFLTYSQASIWMSGIINSIYGIAGYMLLVMLLVKKIKKKENITAYLSVFIIGSALFLLLVFGYKKGFIPLIDHPEINIPNLFNKTLNVYHDWRSTNIRYGLIMVPFLALFSGFVAVRSRILFIIMIIFISFQLYTNLFTPLYLQFSISKAQAFVEVVPATWLQSQYCQGLILVSARTHEDLIFQTKLPYKYFIHEGTKHYWTDSLNDPAKYATWVIYSDHILEEDRLPNLLTPNAYEVLQKKFLLVYQDNKGFKIFKRI